MTALADLSDYVNRATGGNSGTPENVFWFKSAQVAGVAVSQWDNGWHYSMWRYDGFPGPGAVPTTVAAPTSATPGAMPFTDPGGGRQKWLMAAGICGPHSGGFSHSLLYDRLLHIGGLDGTVATAQTVGGTLTRHTGGVGNQIWVEIYTAVGTGYRTITASYTNQAGASGRTTQAAPFGGSAGSTPPSNGTNVMNLLPLQAGDTGVQSVQSVTISSSTGTAGNFGVTVAHPIAFLPYSEAGGAIRNLATGGMPGIPAIEAGACIATTLYPGSFGMAPVFGALAFVEA
jgi:hypothetical protein